jgi:transporter family protein
VILIFAWSIALSRGFDTLSKATTRTWLFLILSGLATGASWLCYFRALQLGEASKVAPIDKLSVVLAMVLAALFLGEHLTWRHGLGAVLIVAGTIVIARI